MDMAVMASAVSMALDTEVYIRNIHFLFFKDKSYLLKNNLKIGYGLNGYGALGGYGGMDFKNISIKKMN